MGIDCCSLHGISGSLKNKVFKLVEERLGMQNNLMEQNETKNPGTPGFLMIC